MDEIQALRTFLALARELLAPPDPGVVRPDGILADLFDDLGRADLAARVHAGWSWEAIDRACLRGGMPGGDAARLQLLSCATARAAVDLSAERWRGTYLPEMIYGGPGFPVPSARECPARRPALWKIRSAWDAKLVHEECCTPHHCGVLIMSALSGRDYPPSIQRPVAALREDLGAYVDSIVADLDPREGLRGIE